LYFPETNEIKISKSLFFMKISYHWPNHKVSLDTEWYKDVSQLKTRAWKCEVSVIGSTLLLTTKTVHFRSRKKLIEQIIHRLCNCAVTDTGVIEHRIKWEDEFVGRSENGWKVAGVAYSSVLTTNSRPNLMEVLF
jgi:hypothetical protein